MRQQLSGQLVAMVLALLCFALWGKADESKLRIITLGDSITKGVRTGVKPQETFANQGSPAVRRSASRWSASGGISTQGALRAIQELITLENPMCLEFA